jgi:hypothetical protein
MTMRSLALFTHVLGMLALFVALAVEWTAVELLRKGDRARPCAFATNVLRQLPRFTAVAIVLILGSGIDLAAKFSLLRSAWVGVSFAAMIVMAGLGGAALRPLIRSLGSDDDSTWTWPRQASNPFLQVSIRARFGVALGIVYLMVTKPGLLESAAIVAVALVVGAAGGVVAARAPAPNVSADREGRPAAGTIGGS